MRRFITRLFSSKQPKSISRRTRLSLDCLEDRTVPDATFVISGAILNLVLTASDHVQIHSNDTSYTLRLTNGVWTGTDSANATGNTTNTLTVTSAGLLAFTNIQLTDSGTTGNSVTFADSGTSRYFQSFEITLDELGNNVAFSTFEGLTNFVASAHLTLDAQGGIALSANSTITMQNGDLTLTGDGLPNGSGLRGASGASIVTGHGKIQLSGTSTSNQNPGILLDHTQIQVLATGTVSMMGSGPGLGLQFVGGSLSVGNAQFQATVTGQIDLGGVTFQALSSPQGLMPSNLNYTFVNNDGTDSVIGTFANLPEGSILDYGFGTIGKLTYQGSDGNDVVVTKYIVPSNTLIPPLIHPSNHPERKSSHVAVVGAGASGGPIVKVFDGFNFLYSQLEAYDPAFSGGVRVAIGVINQDQFPEVITAPASGGPAHIKVFDSISRNVIRSFYAFDPSFTGGISLAVADLNGDGAVEIIVGAGLGGSPHIKVFDGLSGNVLASFYAYGSAFSGGVEIATGDITGDGIPDIITGTGPGGSPHVKVFDGTTFTTFRSFFAYDASFSGGIFVKSTDLDGDGRAEIITGVGAGGAPHVKVFDGTNLTLRDSFYAYDPSFLGGVRVGTADVDRMDISVRARFYDGLDAIVLAPGPGVPSHIRLRSNQAFVGEFSFYAFDPTFLGGVYLN